MAGKIQQGLEEKTKLLSKVKKLIKEYMEKLAQLEREYVRLSSWRFLKRFHNLQERQNLTRTFKIQMLELGVLV